MNEKRDIYDKLFDWGFALWAYSSIYGTPVFLTVCFLILIGMLTWRAFYG